MNKDFSVKFLGFLLLFFGLIVGQSFAQFAGGDGTADNPYQITSCTELQEVNNYMGSAFIVMAEGEELDCIDLGNDVMIGGTGADFNTFTGSFDGNNKSIIVQINTSHTRGGLFRSVAGGTIINTNVAGILTGTNRAGGLAGYISSTTISGSSSIVDIRGGGNSNFAIGGLVGGSVNSEIHNSFASGTIITQGTVTDVGGLIGLAEQGILVKNSYTLGSINTRARAGGILGSTVGETTIQDSYANLSFTGTRWVGGILGFTSGATMIDNSYFSGELYASTSDIGGILGATLNSSNITISSSYALGTITSAGINPGGLIGVTSAATTTLVTGSYFEGNVLGSNWVGGVIGSSNGEITVSNSYVVAYATGTNNGGVGGVAGYSNDTTVINSYVMGTIHGVSRIGGIVGYGINLTATNAYVAGLVSGTNNVGGLNGIIDGGTTDISGSYRDLLDGNNVSSNVGGGSGLSTTAMKNITTFTTAERDIASYGEEQNNGYPFLAWEIGETNPIRYITNIIAGCTDADASNYNEDANSDDGSCTYPQQSSGGGGGGGSLSIDSCPDGDFSGSYYDNTCGEQPEDETSTDYQEETNEEESTGTEGSTPEQNICELNPEYQDAYDFAFAHEITTMPTCEDANMNGTLIRAHAAKMMSNYAMNVLDMEPDTNKVCEFDDMGDETQEMQNYAIIACQLGLMGLAGDGITPTASFNPNVSLDKAQFATVLSRMMYGAEYDNNQEDFWAGHVQAMQDAGIITVTTDLFDPLRRAYAMIMLMRTAIE